jgi:hypothetical protein
MVTASLIGYQSSTFKQFLGYLSIGIMVAAYVIYLRQTLLKRVLPHPLSWFLFGSTTLVAFFVQVSKNAGPGSWVVGLTSLVCFVLCGVSWRIGRKLAYSAGDWVFFSGSLIVLCFYIGSVYICELDPTLSAIVATAADVLGYGPTVMKGLRRPYEDSAISFFLNGVKFIPSFFALESRTLATYIFPVTLIFVNGGVALMLALLRWHITVDVQRRP